MMTAIRTFKAFRPHKLQKSITKSSAVRLFHIRHACIKDMDFVTLRAIKEKRHVGPYDFSNAFAFDPKRFFVGEVHKKVVGYMCAITYPNHHSHLGSCILEEEHRGKGYGIQLYNTCYGSCDKRYTIGGDVRITDLKTELLFKAGGFQVVWNTYIAMLSADKVTQKLTGNRFPFQVTIKPINMVSLSSLLEYDSFVFGTSRHAFIKRWIITPGSFGLVAVKDSNCDCWIFHLETSHQRWWYGNWFGNGTTLCRQCPYC